MIVALVSCWREGPLLEQCVASVALNVDRVGVFEGYAGEGDPAAPGEASPLEQLRAFDPAGRMHIEPERRYRSDADKRSAMLKWARRHGREPLWVLWLDGDEVLLWGQYLRDLTRRQDMEQTATGGLGIRLVELDGSVVMCYGKLIRADRVRRYLVSSYQVELETGMIVALPNVPLCGAGGIPLAPEDGVPDAEAQGLWLARCRPPLQGEPHLLHRSALRHPDRAPTRLHDAEAEWFPAALQAAGLRLSDGREDT